MGQLVQLQKSYSEFTKLDAEIVIVFREEKEGQAGLAKSQKTAKAEFPLLNDLGGKVTGPYSLGKHEYTTYIIDKQGVIQAVLAGSTYKRPTSKQILAALQKVVSPEK